MVVKKKAGSKAVGDRRNYRYYDLIMAAFVCVLLCSNLIGVSKVVTVAGFTFGGGNLFFPLSYLFGDILTEVYGYARSRRVVWAGFGAMIFASLMAWIVVTLPPAEGHAGQEALEQIFASTPRIVAASIFAYFIGEMTNSFILAKLKVRTEGRFLWLRTIGSTMGGEAIDSLLFYPLAFYGTWSNDLLLKVMLANYVIKVGWEVLATPLTYRIVSFLKKKEDEDYFDRDTNFTPFSLKV
ncbi:MAG TPA: queuosine precursor transporter [Oligoflexus sp.]|uniref:queuosine precursor transporter n=1 Tax=Oligoflexus sp. TaxID=1971216 RepID=UPI002D6631C2|nr:queuosine precursor transporter [Oligoflexus sp.]HYX38203.1 queuosine precursor transporter [Oligoflexus sp.]